MIIINSARLLIRDHVPDDLIPLHRLISHPTAMRYLPEIATQSLEESQRNLTVALSEAESDERERFFFAIIEKNSGQYIGEIGFTVEQRAAGGLVVNLGYFILPDWWGQGLVTEAAGKVMEFAFEECHVHKITTGCLKENAASERVMVKCGFKKEAEFKCNIWHENQWKDRVEYGLLKDEWRQIQNQRCIEDI